VEGSDLSPSPYVSSYRTSLNSQENFLAAPLPAPKFLVSPMTGGILTHSEVAVYLLQNIGNLVHITVIWVDLSRQEYGHPWFLLNAFRNKREISNLWNCPPPEPVLSNSSEISRQAGKTVNVLHPPHGSWSQVKKIKTWRLLNTKSFIHIRM
jgi:hypothetical protein